MSDVIDQTTDASSHLSDTTSTRAPQPPVGPSVDKKHQLTVPNPLSRGDICSHIESALESISAGNRVAVFDAAQASEVPTVVVRPQPGTAKFILLESGSESMDSTETLSEQEAVERIADILGTRTREAVGEFFTKSSVGPAAGTLISQY